MRHLSIVWLTAVCIGFLASAVPAQDTVTTASAPWYSLFGDNRSDTFSDLRLKRLEMSRELNGLEAEVRELRLKNEVLDASIKRQKLSSPIGRSVLSRASDGLSLDELTDKRNRMEFENKQRIDDLGRWSIADEARLKELLQIGVPSPENQQEIDGIKKRLATAPDELVRMGEQYKFDISQIDVQIERARSEQAQLDAMQAEEEKARAAALAGDEKAFSDNNSAIATKQARIATLNADIETIDGKILKLIDVGDTDGWFKIIISLSFAALVAAVILGFYRVINGNKGIVHAIFSNDSGIQFITVFSIIIAVILFGIIGVLEGKELSALLGGLSGFILGRNSAPAAKPEPDHADPSKGIPQPQ